jgi:predicted metal-dependent peptidase
LGAAAGEVADGLDGAEADLVRRHVARAVQAAQGKGRGMPPQGLARWAGEVLTPPTVPWDRVLRAVIRRALADQSGRTNYSYARPSRRSLPGIVAPAMRGPSITVSIVIDTSGSMSAGDLSAAMGEVAGVLRAGGVARERVRILSCDAASTSAQAVRSVADVQLVGGGGTDMRVGIDAANAARPAPHVVIVLTDGDTPWPDRPSRAHLVCAVIGNDAALSRTPEWASRVQIPVGAS